MLKNVKAVFWTKKNTTMTDVQSTTGIHLGSQTTKIQNFLSVHQSGVFYYRTQLKSHAICTQNFMKIEAILLELLLFSWLIELKSVFWENRL